jgi:hypothetical protein
MPNLIQHPGGEGPLDNGSRIAVRDRFRRYGNKYVVMLESRCSLSTIGTKYPAVGWTCNSKLGTRNWSIEILVVLDIGSIGSIVWVMFAL